MRPERFIPILYDTKLNLPIDVIIVFIDNDNLSMILFIVVFVVLSQKNSGRLLNEKNIGGGVQ